MPLLDGISATKQVREWERKSGRRTKIVILSANAMEVDQQLGMAAGADGYLTKPIELNKLVVLLQAINPGLATGGVEPPNKGGSFEHSISEPVGNVMEPGSEI